MKAIITKKQYKEIVNLFKSPQEFIDLLEDTKELVKFNENSYNFICTTLENKCRVRYGATKSIILRDLIDPIISNRDRIPKRCKTKNYMNDGLAIWRTGVAKERVIYLEALIKKCESYQIT